MGFKQVHPNVCRTLEVSEPELGLFAGLLANRGGTSKVLWHADTSITPSASPIECHESECAGSHVFIAIPLSLSQDTRHSTFDLRPSIVPKHLYSIFFHFVDRTPRLRNPPQGEKDNFPNTILPLYIQIPIFESRSNLQSIRYMKQRRRERYETGVQEEKANASSSRSPERR